MKRGRRGYGTWDTPGTIPYKRLQAQKRRRAKGWRKTGGVWKKRRMNLRTAGYLGIELKFYDKGVVANAFASSANCSGGELDPSPTTCFTTISQGDGESNRDGRKATIKSLYLKGMVVIPSQPNQAGAERADLCFLAVVLDTQTNGAQLNSEDVYTNPGGDASGCAVPFRNLQYSKRFKILATRLITLHDPNMTYDGTNIEQAGYTKPFKINLPNLNIECNYSNTTETIANSTDNSIHIIGFTNSTGLGPMITYNSRTRFVG